ncbi:MAG TPA: hypothetical protein VKZ59_07715 [Acidobacteriota bacterium]|nr:hypothetical protein [Acidobacteriota bacterium]
MVDLTFSRRVASLHPGFPIRRFQHTELKVELILLPFGYILTSGGFLGILSGSEAALTISKPTGIRGKEWNAGVHFPAGAYTRRHVCLDDTALRYGRGYF